MPAAPPAHRASKIAINIIGSSGQPRFIHTESIRKTAHSSAFVPKEKAGNRPAYIICAESGGHALAHASAAAETGPGQSEENVLWHQAGMSPIAGKPRRAVSRLRRRTWFPRSGVHIFHKASHCVAGMHTRNRDDTLVFLCFVRPAPSSGSRELQGLYIGIKEISLFRKAGFQGCFPYYPAFSSSATYHQPGQEQRMSARYPCSGRL